MKRRQIVEKANEIVSIFDVLESEFDISHPRSGNSYKGFCPFGFEHPDGGQEKGFRTYPETNTANCFVMHGSFTPVRLVSVKNEWSFRRSAEYLLRKAGLLDHRPWRERWPEIVQERAKAQEAQRELGDRQTLVQALHEALSVHPAYPAGGLSPALDDAMEVCLRVLDQLADRGAGPEVIQEWFDRSKVRLRKVLDEEEAHAQAT